jgi:HD-GYP domain-containing protein (c-di-GMP phosphodiesterase class II)
MNRENSVNVGSLILSFSDSMDLASPDLTKHQQRTAYISWRIGRAANLSRSRIEDIFVSALLHDIGAFSFEEKEALQKSTLKNLDEHCIRGEKLLQTIPWLQKSAKIVRYHHTPYQKISKSKLVPIIDSQILYLSDFIERQIDRDKCILQQQEKIIKMINGLAGTHFHPQIVENFLEVSYREEFWLDLVSPRLYYILKDGPFANIDFSFDDILLISELFRNIIDLRSRFTSTHSSGVSIAASILARKFGFTNSEVKMMKVAGNLHDIGKLAIPDNILNKETSLNKEETAIMRSHTYHTYAIINQIEGLQQIARWAAYHHEKLDGSGYPFHCTADDLSISSRIMAVADIFTALVEHRPYRVGLDKQEISRIFNHFLEKKLIDAKIVELLFSNFEEIFDSVNQYQADTRVFYENQFEYKDAIEVNE